MLEYRPSSTNEEFVDPPGTSAQNEGKVSLTKLWEVIVRTNRLPDGISESFLYDSVCEKLRDPEREVRQHALRVLMDLIPVTHPSNLHNQMQNLLPEILRILSHSSPSLRKGALDALKKYLKFSNNYNHLMTELLGSSDFTTVAPFLIGLETDDKTVKLVVDRLWKDLENPNLSQEIIAKSLARLRYNIGDERFKHIIGFEQYHYLQEICEIYGLPIDYSDGDFSDNEKLWSDEEVIEDRVILETEITLRTGPAITMKIHEEGKPSSSIEDNSKFGVIKVLDDDSESDFEEVARRTPRKVRFGGESVKLRTPESDSSNPDESKSTLRITVSDAVSITTKKSLIPVRITSLPSTPLRSSKKVTRKRLYESAPNLARNFSSTKIPFRRDSNLAEKFKINEVKTKGKAKPMMNIKSKSSDHLPVPKVNTSVRSSPSASPRSTTPVQHNEIEVFHNLTRSPIRQRRPSTVNTTNFKEIIESKEILIQNGSSSFNSFKLFPSTICEDDSVATNEVDSSFTVCELPKENKILALPPPEDVRNKNNVNGTHNNSESSSTDKISEERDGQLHVEAVPNQIKALEYLPSEKKNGYGSFKVFASDTGYVNTLAGQDENLTKQNGGFDLNRQWQISSLSSDETVWNKSEALDSLVKMLKQPNTCETLESGPAALLFEALFACQHLDKLHFLADDALALMVKGVRPEVLDQCLGRLTFGMCKIGAPSGVSLGLLVMKKCLPKRVLGEVMDRCFAHKTREGALQLLMASARLLPRNELEVQKMTEFAAATLRDRRKRVRHAALETLATLAQLGSNMDVLEVVDRVTKASPDHQYLLRVVRTRLSRRQLPTVELDGTVRYSTPRDQTELEWLSGRNNSDTQSVSSSASSSNNSVNYWRHNSRHDEDDPGVESALSSTKDDSANNKQVWAVDPVVFHKNGHTKENTNKVNPPILRPVYILQPEAVTEGGKGHRRYDRGRSFSPPKPNHKQAPQHVTASTAQNLVTTPRYKDGVRKSFSSEQLFIREREHHEPYSFSLSSRSSTTSTGSSTKSGTWYKEMRSGIPVPISSETKFRFRTNTTNSNASASGPVIARRSAIGSVPNTPVITRLSPRDSPEKNNPTNNVLPPPPQSSGSESSGYFTPPPESKKAFVKIDSVDRTSESEDKEDVDNDTNNNVEESVEEVDNASEFVKRNLSASSAETTDPNEEPIPQSINSSPIKTEIIEKEEYHRFSISRSKESLFTEKPISEYRSKSKSVVDLQSFLPEISLSRKNINSAPLFKDDLIANGNLVISTTEEVHTVIPISQSDINENPESPTKEITITRKLSRRLSRTQSRRSVKSTPRDPTPSSSRVNSKSKDSLQVALTQLNNPEWEVMIQGLQTLTRIAKYYPEIIEGQMHTVCVNLAKHIKNLRSQVARAACHTASELFGSCKRSLEVEIEELAGPLLHRTADTNKFLRSDANAALDVMCEHLPINRVISVITSRGCTHQNSIVRSASIRLLTDLVKRHGADKMFQMNKEVRDKIILAGANSLADGSLDARSHGKEMISHLVGHPQFQKALLDVVPQNTLRHIGKTLNSVKPHVGT